MARHGVSAAERRRIAAELERLSRASEAEVKRIVASLYARIRDLPPEQALRVLREAMPQAADRIAAAISQQYEAAAAAGGGRAAAGLGLSGATRQAARAAANALGASYATTGGIPLSAAIHGRTAQILRGVESAVRGAISNGRSALDLAQRLRDDVRDLPRVGLTQRLEDIRRRVRAAAAAAGNPRAAAQAQRLIRDLNQYAAKLQRTPVGMGAATEHLADQIAKAVATGNDALIDDALRWWTYDKQNYHHRMTARTEMARGYTEGFKANADVPWVVGFKVNLESGARKPDICDVYAEQNLYGMGAGVYPFDRLIAPPYHPNCSCYITEKIDKSVTEDDRRPPPPPQRSGATEAALRQMPAARAREILGRSGYEQFRKTGTLPGRFLAQ